MAKGVEVLLKDLILSKNKVVYYRADVTWPTNFNRGGFTEEDNRIPEQITFTLQELTLKEGVKSDNEKEKPKNWERKGKVHAVEPINIKPIASALSASKYDKLAEELETNIDDYPGWRTFYRIKNLNRELKSGGIDQEEFSKLENLYIRLKK